jgi:hypothetical protein
MFCKKIGGARGAHVRKDLIWQAPGFPEQPTLELKPEI